MTINNLLMPHPTFGPTHEVDIADAYDEPDDDEMLPDDCPWIKAVIATFGWNPNELSNDPECV